ncbi:hypothetical protein Esi_0126_0041 [Ectocarpus siliculosus]|uniref:Uncharacterized protein n=1 Tax=Ectocarpus siliculosus TaxID=2880 RepID=D8LDT9_ECTSI|nr:hypothetical protein Esi_0126_0041 [Ectocarpus siliculosus]|eukprot:CBN78496.1 hypothetical protein Esi_0126_0041 [Ectocarpus siliculosus]
MCASFAPPKHSAAFTVGKAGQDVAEPARRRTYSSNGRRNRSPSPLSRELLNGGRNAFSSEDAVTPLSTAGSGGGYHFGSGEGTPTPLSISQSLKARGGYSFNGGVDSTTMPAALPLVSPTGDGGPASPGFSSTAASGGTTTATAGVSNATAAANAIPTFSEITRGAIDRNGAVPLEPFARARASRSVAQRRRCLPGRNSRGTAPPAKPSRCETSSRPRCTTCRRSSPRGTSSPP